MEKKQLNLEAPLLSVRKSTILGSSESDGKQMKNVAKTVNVPFVWERIPGTPKIEGIVNLHVPTNIPNLPPGRRRSEHFLDRELIEILRESVDDAAVESVSLNCSISGLRDYEEFNVDKQTGEFMMNHRFLPASKAAILETPRYNISKKRCVVSEQQLLSPVVRSWMPVKKGLGFESSSVQRSRKTSRFLPHLCVKNSLCIENPKAIMKSNAAVVPKSGTNDLTRFTRKNCRDQNHTRKCQPNRLSYSSTNPKSYLRHCDSMARAIDEVETERKRESCDVDLEAPLRLPESPADSWLWKTMHHVRLNNADAVPFYAKKLGHKQPVCSTKWETIVKTSHLHRSNFSEELVRHISH